MRSAGAPLGTRASSDQPSVHGAQWRSALWCALPLECAARRSGTRRMRSHAPKPPHQPHIGALRRRGAARRRFELPDRQVRRCPCSVRACRPCGGKGRPAPASTRSMRSARAAPIHATHGLSAQSSQGAALACPPLSPCSSGTGVYGAGGAARAGRGAQRTFQASWRPSGAGAGAGRRAGEGGWVCRGRSQARVAGSRDRTDSPGLVMRGNKEFRQRAFSPGTYWYTKLPPTGGRWGPAGAPL